jgi:hypothetical protein
MRFVLTLALASLVVPQPPPAQTAHLPPPYPRAGTRALIDNERVQVWDVSWPKTTTVPPMHRHLYDMTGIYYWPGDRLITSPEGAKRPVHTDAGRIQWQLKGVTHIEEGTSDDPLRAVMVELKGDGPSGTIDTSNSVPAFAVTSMPLLDNERVTVWDATGAAALTTRHRHPRDTVIVFTKEKTARATYLPAGTVHAADDPADAAKVTAFELK